MSEIYGNLSSEDIEFMEHFYTPRSIIENLIPLKEHSPQVWDENEPCFVLYDYQVAMLDYSEMYANDIELTKKQNIQTKKMVGDLLTVGSRNTGKSFIAKIDVFLSFVYGECN